MSKVTFLTPTFNRASYLPRLYESLCAQTNHAFQWLIIDDGSTDETELVVAQLKENHILPFEITYRKKENGGKHTALNAAHPYIHSPYVMVLDSDDFLPSNGVDLISEAQDTYNQGKRQTGWFAFLKGDTPETTKDPLYTQDGERTDYITYMNNGRKGEAGDVYLTELFIAYPYPEVPGEKFVSESYLNIQAAVYGNYDMVTINKVIQVTEYLDEGLTSLGRKLQLLSPAGNAELWRHVAQPPFSWKLRLKGAWLYIAYSFFAGKKATRIVKESLAKSFTFFNLPFGYGLYRFWKKQYFGKE